MNPKMSYAHRRHIWRVLPPPQRQRLLALLGVWIRRSWEEQQAMKVHRAITSGGRHEGNE